MKKIRYESVRRVFSYIIMLAFTVIFALYLSGRTGWFLFTVMIMMPLISLFAAFIMRRCISIETSITETTLFKGKDTVLGLTVRNSGFFPTPPVIIELQCSDGLASENASEKLSVTVLPRSEQTFETQYKAVRWCYAKVGVSAVYIMDYLFMIPIKLPAYSGSGDISYDVKIIPDIKSLESSSELLKQADEAAARFSDSEETSDTRALGFTGVAGYEHREYVPGDPLKRINWKLSAKKDRLMVRLDENLTARRHAIVLDRVDSSGNTEYAETCGETMLGILSLIVQSGYSAAAWFYSGSAWINEEIEDEGSLEKLRLDLAGYRFEKSADVRIPFDEISENTHNGGTIILFTPCLDAAASAQTAGSSTYAKNDVQVMAAAASFGDNVNASGAWLIGRDGSMTSVH